MTRKKVLDEVRALGSIKNKSQVKSKAKDTVANNNQWEAWECRRGDSDNPINWNQIWEGSLDGCFELLHDPIHCQIEEEFWVGEETLDIEELEEKYGHLPDGVLHELQKKAQPYLDAFKAQCLEKGECQGWNWLIAASPSKLKRHI
jgi:hypothetical protein